MEDFNIEVLAQKKRGKPFTGTEDFLGLINEVASFGKKPANYRFQLFIRQMAKMITTVEDDTDEKFVESRRYRYNTNMIVQSKVA